MAEPLGTYGGSVRQTAIDPDTGEILATPSAPLSADQKRRRKYARARSMAQLLQHKDLAGCHAWAQSKAQPVVVNVKPQVQRSGFFTNVQTCGLVHLCAHCQAKVAARRSIEIKDAIDAWQAQGGDVVMVTLTLSHGRTHPLADTLAALKDAGRRLARHRSFTGLKDRLGLVGRIVATELTHGANGWHPHQHQLWFVRAGTSHAEIRDVLSPAWQASLLKSGFTASEARGVKVNGGDKAAQYVAKMSTGEQWTLADEMARAASKTGRGGSRSIWQMVDTLADRAAAPEARQLAATLLREFAGCIKGTRPLVWSPGLKARFHVEEVSDEVLAAESQEPDTVPVVDLDFVEFGLVVRYRSQADVLTLAEDSGADAVRGFVEFLRARSAVPSLGSATRAEPVRDAPPGAHESGAGVVASVRQQPPSL